MNTPRVSVVMTVLDGERYLGDAVRSILEQTFSDLEFIVLDDGSTDSTWDQLSAFAARDSRLRLVRNAETLGVRRSLNKGFALARGEYIARQDADDRSAPERLAAQVAFLDAHPEVGLAGTLVQVIDSGGAPLGVQVFQEAMDDEALRRLLLDTCPICHGSVMLRRRCLDLTGFYDEGMVEAEDYDLWLRLADVTRLANLEQRLYYFRYYSDSVSSRRHPKVMLYMASVLERAVRRRHGARPSAEQFVPVARAYLRAAVASFAGREPAEARERMAQALALWPSLFEADNRLPELLWPYTTRVGVEAGQEFVAAVFDGLFLPSRRLSRLKSRMLSQLDMKEVFAAVGQGDWARIRAHLWPGVRRDPTWLMNRGVASLLLQSPLRHRLER